jgi:flagellar basal-body rod modification protein FlgD
MNVQGISPAIAAPVPGLSANSATNAASAASSSTSSSSSTSGLSSSDLESTFLNLLVTELQNQDPTQPVDPTEMVSQMVSLNQLDQLISINQTLTNMSSGTSGSSPTSDAAGQSSSANQSGLPAAGNTLSPVPTATPGGLASGLFQIPPALVGPAANSGAMNLYSSFGLPEAKTKSIHTGDR